MIRNNMMGYWIFGISGFITGITFSFIATGGYAMFKIPGWAVGCICGGIVLMVVIVLSSAHCQNLPSEYQQVFDKDWNRKASVKDDRILDNDKKIIGYIKKDGTIYDNKWNRVGKVDPPPAPKNLRVK